MNFQKIQKEYYYTGGSWQIKTIFDVGGAIFKISFRMLFYGTRDI